MRAKGAEGERCVRFEREGLIGALDEITASCDSERDAGSRAAPTELATHFETCADCRAERAGYQRLARAMADLGRSYPTPDPVARVLAIVGDDARAPRLSRPRVRQALRMIGPALALAAAVAMVWWLMQ